MKKRAYPKRIIKKTTIFITAFMVAGVFSLPLLWIFLTSVKSTDELFSYPVKILPEGGWYWQAYLKIWEYGHFEQYFINSIKISTLVTFASVVIAALAALGFARYLIKGRNLFMMIILASQLFPLVLLVPPYYKMLSRFNILDSHLSLMIAYISFALPYSIWMLTGYVRAIPIELEESAMIDGATRLKAYLKITLPLALPGLVATFIYCFILAWNEFLFATTFISTPSLRTLPIGLHAFIGQYGTDWNLLMSGAIITTIPVVILFVLLQQFFINTLTSGAFKM